MNARTTTRRRFLAGGLGLLALTACGSPDRAAPSPDAPDGGFPRTVRHEAGETVVPAVPERVVTLTDYADLDLLLALGVRPVLFGFTDAWGTGSTPWQAAAGVAELPRMEVTAMQVELEQVAAARPDLVIGMPPAVESLEQLSGIAPTICLGWETPWRDGLGTVAAALGREKRVAELVRETEAATAAAADRLGGLGGTPVMVGAAYRDQLYLQGDASPLVVLLRELGLTVRTTGAGALVAYSPEEVGVLEPAGILLSPATDPAATAAAEASELWRRLPAMTAGRYSAVDATLSRGMADGFSPLSAGWVLERLVPLLERTAAGAGTPLGGGAG